MNAQTCIVCGERDGTADLSGWPACGPCLDSVRHVEPEDRVFVLLHSAIIRITGGDDADRAMMRIVAEGDVLRASGQIPTH